VVLLLFYFHTTSPSFFLAVYTLLGNYNGLNGNETAWTPVSKARVLPLPSGRTSIIPVQQFDTVSMAANELRSFYITMNGRYLDSTSEAMKDRGSLDRDFDGLFSLDVGGGLGEYKFPALFDDVVHPKFAGVIHYQEAAECEEPIATIKTRVDFDFLVDIYEEDETIFAQVTSAVQELLEGEMISPGGRLKDLVDQHNLQIFEGPTSTKPRVPLRE